MIRIIGAIVAVILVVVGGLAIFLYVQNADVRAAQGQKLESVYIVQTPIPKGTSGASIQNQVKIEQLPASAIQPGIVTNLSTLENKVANTDLLQGDQLVMARFSSPEELAAGGTVPVPKGMQEVTIALAAPQMVGGQVKAGDHVGIVYTGVDGRTNTTNTGAQNSGEVTQFLYQQVLVTDVIFGVAATQTSTAPNSNSGSNSNGSTAQTAGTLMVTFAVTALQASKIIFAAQHGGNNSSTLWLTLQNSGTTAGAPQIGSGNIFQ